MEIFTTLGIAFLIISIILTLLIAGKGEENYSSSTKRNTKNLTLIYASFIFLVLIALGIFFVNFA